VIAALQFARLDADGESILRRLEIPFTLLVPGLGGISGNGTNGRNSEARPWYEPRNSGRGPDFVTCDL